MRQKTQDNRRRFLRVVIFLAASAVSPATAGLSEGLQAYWMFDEGSGTTAVDASTQVYPTQAPHPATLYNGPAWIDGVIGRGISLDGSDDYAGVAAAPEINNLGPMTLALWMNAKSPTGFLFMKGHKEFRFYDTLNAPRNLRFAADFSSANLEKYSANNSFPLNQWVHVAVTWDGKPLASGVHMFVNGVETSYRSSQDGAGTRDADDYNLFIGKYSYASNPSHFFNGSLDELVVYNRVLSALEIHDLYTLTASGSSIPLFPINKAPAISVSPPITVQWPNSGVLSLLVSDDGFPPGAPVSTDWSLVSGATPTTFSRPSSPLTEVSFPAPGSYIVRLTASDGSLPSHQDVQVNVIPSPLQLQVQKSGTGSGHVSGLGIDCGSECINTYSDMTSVTLTATPNSGSKFSGWTGGQCAGTGSCVVTIGSATIVTALFDTDATGARTFYVDNQNISARDTNPGTLDQPWKTIQKAASSAVAGDRIIVRRGEYNEYVIMQQNGMEGSPIIFEGERGPGGEWLTIIDPSTPASTGWVPAPEIGSGVYKKTDIGFDTHELTIDHKRVAFVWSLGDMSTSINNGFENSGLTTGAQILALPAEAVLTTNFGTSNIRFWDGVEALYGSEGGVTYLRFRDGRNPNGLNIRAAPNRDGSQTRDIYKPAVQISNKSHLVFRNFMIRGAFGGVQIYYANSHHNIIENNYLMHGYSRVTIGGEAYENVVRNNEITANYYGYADPGSWGNGNQYKHTIRKHLYIVSKFLMGGATEDEHGIKLIGAGRNNEIYGNRIFNGIGQGIYISGPTSRLTIGTDIHDNIISNTSCHGLMIWEGHSQTRIHDNLMSDTNINFRLHHMNAVGETDRVVYIYRNRSWLPEGAGSHLYTHFNQTSGSYHPEFWIYHNSFSGGGLGLMANQHSLSGLRFINNIFSGAQYVGNGSIEFMTNAGWLGLFDYNLVNPPFIVSPLVDNKPAWFVNRHNIEYPAPLWSLSGLPDFSLPADSPAIDAGLNLSIRFVANGRVYDPLPGMSPGGFMGSAPDLGAYEIGGVGTPRTFPDEGILWHPFKNIFNPMKESLMIQFTLTQPGPVSLIVYNRKAREIRQMLNEDRPAGLNSVEWDGRNESGNRVASDVYNLILKVGGTTKSMKIVVVK